jgi:Zn finger protein HypA/HybF involved in hydrogenase expression
MSAHDRHLTGYSSFAVDITCRSCDHSFDGTETSEYGTGWLEPEECPQCGSNELETSPMSDYDIAERKAEARGEDF